MARTEDPAGRERILSAATALFYANGVRAVGVAEVIAAAGCGKNMLYRHFPSKAALAAAYLRRVRAERDKSTARALAAASAGRATGAGGGQPTSAGAGEATGAGARLATGAGQAMGAGQATGAGAGQATGAGEQLVALVAEVAAWVQRAD